MDCTLTLVYYLVSSPPPCEQFSKAKCAKAKYDVGDQLFGQQGVTPRGGKFGLHEWKRAAHDSGEEQDDTSSLNRGDMRTPLGPRADRYAPKRVRGNDMYESVGRLQYD